jgi:hypothetical protein
MHGSLPLCCDTRLAAARSECYHHQTIWEELELFNPLQSPGMLQNSNKVIWVLRRYE